MLLSITNLTITVRGQTPEQRLVDSLDLKIPERSIAALVGGSGSGKTTTGLAVLRLLAPALRVGSGEILFRGEDLLQADRARLRGLRGGEISMVFQEPLNAFNPVFPIGYQIEEVLRVHTSLEAGARRDKILKLLGTVGVPEPKRVAGSYPHQLSGGLRQRAMIAQAIAAGPKLVIADEPTSNLDVTLQARIMEVFRKLKEDLGLSVLLITHDLGVVEHLADTVTVMTGGRVVESGATAEVMGEPKHPYTKSLLKALEV